MKREANKRLKATLALKVIYINGKWQQEILAYLERDKNKKLIGYCPGDTKV